MLSALILAAGFGTRMRPLTEELPKPLLPVFGVELLDLAITKVKQAGVSQIFVNGHYLKDKIHQFLSTHHPDVIFVEEEDILGTGGAIHALRPKIKGQGLMILNADILTDFDLHSLSEGFQKGDHEALLVLKEEETPQKTPVAFQKEVLKGFGKSEAHDTYGTFLGIHVLSQKIMAFLPEGFSSIIDAYQKALEQGLKIGTLFHKGAWFDLGTPKDFFKAHQMLSKLPSDQLESFGYTLDHPHLMTQKNGYWASPSVELDQPVEISESFLGYGTCLGAHSVIKQSILLNTTIQRDQTCIGKVMLHQKELAI